MYLKDVIKEQHHNVFSTCYAVMVDIEDDGRNAHNDLNMVGPLHQQDIINIYKTRH